MKTKGIVGMIMVLAVVCLTTLALAEDFGSIAGGGMDYSGGGGAAQESSAPVTFQPAGEALENASNEGTTETGVPNQREPELHIIGVKESVMGTVDYLSNLAKSLPEIINGAGSQATAVDKVFTPALNNETISGASSISTPLTVSKYDTKVQIGAADNYKKSIAGSGVGKIITDDDGTSLAVPVTFSGPTQIDYNIAVRDQGDDAPDYMWLNSPLTTLSVLNSNENSQKLVINDKGEGIYTSQGETVRSYTMQGDEMVSKKTDTLTQTIVFNAAGELSGIVDQSEKGTLNLAFQNDQDKIFGNVGPSFWSFECNTKYGLSYKDQVGPDKLMLHPSYDGTVLGLIPTTDPELGTLNTVHIKADTIDFIYEKGTKQAEDFIRTDVEYWFGGENGIEVVPKGGSPGSV